MRSRKALVAGVAVATMLSLAACGGGDDTDTGPSAEDTFQEGQGAGDFKDATAQGPAPEVEGAREGGIITVLHPDPDDGPDSLDPTSGWSVTDNGILQSLVFRSLTTFRRNPDTGTMELVPDLATDLGTPNEDFTEWQFTIKDGIRWETGEPVTAEDVAFGIKRSFDTESLEGPGAVYSKGFFLGGDKYDGPYVDGANYQGVVVNGNTITIKMAKPFSEMDYWGSFMAMGPVPSGKAGQPPQYGLDPLATGPYKVKSFTPNQELVLERNTEWDPATDPARHQYVDGWIMKFDQDTSTTDELMLADNEQSATTINTQLQGSNYQEAKSKLGDRVMVGAQTCTYFWAPEYQKITDIKVRQAIAFGYAYEDVWSAAGDIPGITRVMGTSILPPGMAGRKEYESIPGEEIRYDPEKAKALLAEAGYEPGEFELKWAYDSSTPEGKAGMQQAKTGFEAAGFKATPFPYAGGSLYDVWTDPDNNIHKKLNVQGTAWCQDWPSAATFIPPLFKTGEFYNTGKFSEKAVDDRIAEIPTLPLAEQPAAWGDLDEMIMQDYFPVVNIGYLNNLFAWGSKIGNFQNDGAQGYPDFRGMYVME